MHVPLTATHITPFASNFPKTVYSNVLFGVEGCDDFVGVSLPLAVPAGSMMPTLAIAMRSASPESSMECKNRRSSLQSYGEIRNKPRQTLANITHVKLFPIDGLA